MKKYKKILDNLQKIKNDLLVSDKELSPYNDACRQNAASGVIKAISYLNSMIN